MVAATLASANRIQRLARSTNGWTSVIVILAVIILMIGGIAYFTGANTDITNLMNGVSIAAMALVILSALVMFSVYWFRNTKDLGLDGFLIMGMLQAKAGNALVISLLTFIASFQIYSTARITPA